MARKTVHKKPHKFKRKNLVKKRDKTVRKKETVKTQPKIEKQEQQKEKAISVQEPVAESSFPELNKTTSQTTSQTAPTIPQENTVVSQQSQPAKVEEISQPKEEVSKEPQNPSGISFGASQEKANVETSSVQNSGHGGSMISENKDTTPPLQNSEGEQHKKSKLWIILIFAIILAIVGGGLYYFREEFILKPLEQKEEQEKKTQEQPSPVVSEASPTAQLEEMATTSADAEVDPSEYSIMLLNGSGIAGQAASVRDILEEAGFVVEDIGNAESSDYTKTIIQAKEDVSEEFLDLLREDLGQKYLLDETQELAEDEDTDVVVIIGREEV